MDEQLYLFEAYIDKIYFEDRVEAVPGKKQIVVSVKLGSIVTLEIRSDTLPQKSGEGSAKGQIHFNSGKSYLTSISVKELLSTFEKEHMEVTVGNRGDVAPIGSSNTPWDNCFKEMVLSSKETNEFVTPVYINDDFSLLDNGVKIGNIEVMLRLSCFGRSIQTHFDVMHDENGNTQFILKFPNTATSFICSRYGTGGASTDIIPIWAIFNAGGTLAHQEDKTHDDKDHGVKRRKSASWTTFLERSSSLRRSSIQSEFLFPEYFNVKTPMKESAMTFDIVSLRGRPEDDRFLDFITGKKFADESIHSISIIDYDGNEKIIFYADDKKNAEKTQESEGKAGKSGTKSVRTCQCPKKLNVCKHVLEAIERYEKAHPNLKINGKKVKYEKLLGKRKKPIDEDSDSLLRLRGGMEDDTTPPYVKKKGKGCYNPHCPMAKQLRAVGISQLTENGHEESQEDDHYFCGEFYCPESIKRNIPLKVVFPEEVAPPKFTCKNKYCPAARKLKKLGLGPLAIEKCLGTLYGPVKIPVEYGLSQTYGTFDTYGPYGVFSKTKTPFPPDDDSGKETREVLRLRGGGTTTEIKQATLRKNVRRSKSPVQECHEVMEEFDRILGEYRAALETVRKNEKPKIEQYISRPNTALSSNCGHPRCSYISEPVLPPIHWNCPDPLPSGICTNPDCPYLPKDLKRISKILAKKGRNKLNCTFNSAPECMTQDKMNTECSYHYAECPFSNPTKTVNMMQCYDNMIQNWCNMMSGGNPDLEQLFRNVNCPMVPSCSNPDCPFARGEYGKSDTSFGCSNPDCPFKEEDTTETCPSPDCPFNKKNSSTMCPNPDCPFKKKDSSGTCSNSDCPFKKRSSSERCPNPDCPFNKKNSSTVCPNPECPFKKKDSSGTCSNPDCPFKKRNSSEKCPNPDCPFNTKKSSDDCFNPTCPAKMKELEDACSNPDCHAKKKKPEIACSNPDCHGNKRELENSCSNPDCPSKKQEPTEPCSNPDCPSKKQDPTEPCSNPDCPCEDEKIGGGVVPNPEPKKKVFEPYPKASAELSECACNNPECEDKKNTCSNPECPYNVVKQEKCENPECPYRKDPAVRKKGICGPKSQSICGDTTCPYQEGAVGEQKEEDKGVGKPQIKEEGVPIVEGAIEVTTGDRPSHYDFAPCTLSTCRFLGGKLKCIDCATSTGGKKRKPCPKTCPGDTSCPLAIGAVREKKPDKLKLTKAEIKAERKKFIYDIGDDYPGNHVGHRDCVKDSLIVPHSMGWLWNKQTKCLNLKPRRGWRPGALGKTILAMIDAHRKAKGMVPLDDGKKRRRRRYGGGGDESDTETVQPRPTLQIKRREGVYYITMNPLKDPRTLVPNENPFMECTPLQFKILKAKPTNDFKTCICNDDGIITEPENLSTDSELDIEFTTPAGIIRPENFVKKRNVIHIDTQYDLKDLEEKKKSKLDEDSMMRLDTPKDKDHKDEKEKTGKNGKNGKKDKDDKEKKGKKGKKGK